MQRPLTLFLLGFVLSHYSFGQSPVIDGPLTTFIKGKIKDTLDGKILSNSAVMLLRPSDSILVQYTRTDKEGNFTLKNIPPGRYLLLVTYPSYADYVDQLEVKDTATTLLPPIAL